MAAKLLIALLFGGHLESVWTGADMKLTAVVASSPGLASSPLPLLPSPEEEPDESPEPEPELDPELFPEEPGSFTTFEPPLLHAAKAHATAIMENPRILGEFEPSRSCFDCMVVLASTLRDGSSARLVRR
jgi:hypothetical protein